MNQSYTAVVKQDGQWWIGWIEEVPGVNCQESTRDELLASLRITLGEALEMNRADAKEGTSAVLFHDTTNKQPFGKEDLQGSWGATAMTQPLSP